SGSTVETPAEAAAVPALDPSSVCLRGDTRVVERQDATPNPDPRAQPPPRRRRVPRRIGDEMLQYFLVARVAERFMQALHRLALAIVKQCVEILTGRLAWRLAGKPVR